MGNHKPEIALFFIVFLVVGNFFILNMFVGVIVDSFQRSLDPSEIIGEQSQEEKAHVEDDTSYLEAYSPWRRKLHKFGMSDEFDVAIAVVIILNVIAMAMEHHNSSIEFNFA